MKKIFLSVAMIAMLLSACSRNESIENDRTDRNAIEFGTYTGLYTKASDMVNDNFKSFNVSAYYLNNGDYSSGSVGTEYIPEEEVTRESSSADWAVKSGNKYYWPTGANDRLNFFAVSPATNNVTIDATPIVEFAVNDAVAQQEDLLVAHVMNGKKTVTGLTQAVTLAFKHALTKIQFAVKGETANELKYEITDITINNAANKGTFTFDTGNNIGSWSTSALPADKQDYQYVSTAVVVDKVTSAAAKDIAGTNGALMLIPQSATGITLTIGYKVYQNNIEIADHSTTKKTVNLSGNWELGKNMRYVLNLPVDGTQITFATETLESWATSADTDVTPNK